MRLLAAVGLAGACLATSPLFAADLLGSSPPPMSVPQDGFAAPQSELGSNWYIRGDVGVGEVTQSTVVPTPSMFPVSYPYQTGYVDPNTLNFVSQTGNYNGAPSGSPNINDPFTRGNYQHAMEPTVSLGLGYRVNDWLRLEATYQFFKGPGFNASTQAQCAGVLNPVNNYPAATAGAPGAPVAAGYLYQSNPCTGNLHVTQYDNAAFVNAYADLGRWWLFTPFVGAGVGANVNSISGSLGWVNSTTGQAYTGPIFNQTTGVPQTFVSQTGIDVNKMAVYTALGNSGSSAVQALTVQQSWDRKFSQTKYTIAGQVMAGVGVQISQSATLDFMYRIMSLDIASGLKNSYQNVSMGVRYNLN